MMRKWMKKLPIEEVKGPHPHNQ
jgi:hypothetical protein